MVAQTHPWLPRAAVHAASLALRERYGEHEPAVRRLLVEQRALTALVRQRLGADDHDPARGVAMAMLGAILRVFELTGGVLPQVVRADVREASRRAILAGEDGLPVLFCFHGGGGNGPTIFTQWSFTEVWATYEANRVGGVYPRRWDKQFILVVPDGWGEKDLPDPPKPADSAYFGVQGDIADENQPDPTVPNAPYGSPQWVINEVAAVNLALGLVDDEEQRLLEALATDLGTLGKALPWVPSLFWNCGTFTENAAPRDDVAFVRAILQYLDDTLTPFLPQIRLPNQQVVVRDHAVDPRRCYGFGYSNGAHMGYRLIREMPGVWAAFHMLCGTIGGRRHADLRFVAPTVEINYPMPDVATPATYPDPVSLFVHNGGSDLGRNQYDPKYEGAFTDELWDEYNDLSCPPQAHVALPMNLAHSEKQRDRLMTSQGDDLAAGEVTVTQDVADRYVREYVSLATAIDAFRRLNACTVASPLLPGALAAGWPAPPVVGQADYDPNQAPDRTDRWFARAWVYTRPGARAGDPLENPVVVEYRDERMNHTNYNVTAVDRRYLTVGDVWDWLYAHPKV